MWRDSLHVIKPFKIPREWLKFRAMDFGQARPYAVIWFAVDYDGNMYAYRELYGWGGKPNVGTGETARQIGEKIVKLEKADEDLRYGVLDSACWARTGVTGPTIAEELNKVLSEKGLVPFIPSSKGRLEGADALKQRLIGNVMEDGTYKPAIKFFSTCIHCIRTIPLIGHDKHKPELPDTSAEDHCFIAGTMIHTSRGEVPIEEVTTCDEVLTRKGFRKVLAAGITRRNAQVSTVTLSNGQTLTGTGNHPIFIKGKGFVTLDTVSYGDIIYSVDEVIKTCQENNQAKQIQSYSMGLPSAATQIPKERETADITGRMGGCENKAFAICTGKFGGFTMAKSLKAIMSITKTAIHSTTIFPILSYLTGIAIYANISAKSLRTKILWNGGINIWMKFAKKPPSGTARRRGVNGTANTESNSQNEKPKSLKSNACVFNAGKNFINKAIDKAEANIVQEHVARNTDATTESTTKQEFAQCVGKSLGLTVLAKQKPVAQSADVSVVHLAKGEKTADVYNLTVDGEHEYFANGFLVHNCMDSCIYGVMSRPWTPTRKAEVRRIKDAWRKETEGRSAWTY